LIATLWWTVYEIWKLYVEWSNASLGLGDHSTLYEPTEHSRAISINPLTPTVYHVGTAIKHPVPDWVKPSFVIFDTRALWRSTRSGRHRMLYSCIIWQRWASKG